VASKVEDNALMLRTPMALDQSARRVSAFLRVKKGDHIPLQHTWFASTSSCL
jgi:hypothetical protein